MYQCFNCGLIKFETEVLKKRLEEARSKLQQAEIMRDAYKEANELLKLAIELSQSAARDFEKERDELKSRNQSA